MYDASGTVIAGTRAWCNPLWSLHEKSEWDLAVINQQSN